MQAVHPEITSFKYDPSIRSLMVGVHHAFFFNQRSQRFEVDKNPFGDAHLVPMDNVVVSHDFSQLTFDAEIRRKQRSFVIKAANEHEKILLEIFSRLNARGFTTADDEADHVQLHFEYGKLTSIEIFKDSEAEHALGSLHIFAEGERYLLLLTRPRRKLPLDSLRLQDNTLISRSADEEFVYRLDVQPVIVEIVKRLLTSRACGPLSLGP